MQTDAQEAKMNKPEALSRAQEKILNAWEGLQPRERILLIATTIIIISTSGEKANWQCHCHKDKKLFHVE